MVPALKDLEHIEAFIAQDKPRSAVTFVLALINTIEKNLPYYPGAGRAGRILGTRELIVHQNYIVPYRVKDNHIEILRVLHVSIPWPSDY